MARPPRQRDAFTAIAEPVRRALLDLVEERALPVGDLTARLPVSQSGVSQHLAVLHEAGLVSVTPHGRERRYLLQPDGLRPVAQWIAGHEYWSERLSALGRVLQEE